MAYWGSKVLRSAAGLLDRMDEPTEGRLSTAEAFGQTFEAWCEERGIDRSWTGDMPMFGRQAKENWIAFHERREPRDMSGVPKSKIEVLFEKAGFARTTVRTEREPI